MNIFFAVFKNRRDRTGRHDGCSTSLLPRLVLSRWGRPGRREKTSLEGRKRPPDDKYASAPPHSCFSAARGAGNSGMGFAKPVKSYYAIKILLFWLTV